MTGELESFVEFAAPGMNGRAGAQLRQQEDVALRQRQVLDLGAGRRCPRAGASRETATRTVPAVTSTDSCTPGRAS